MDPPEGKAQVAGLATAVPTIRVSIEDVSLAVRRVRGRGLRPPAPREAGTRYFAQPLTSIMAPRSVSEQTDTYLEDARILARRVSCEALDRSGIGRDAVGLVIGVSCTRFVLPSLAAELIPILGLRRDVARLPIAELGCGAGVAGLARAAD